MRNRKRITSRGQTSKEDLDRAADLVKVGGSVRSVSKETGIDRMTLTRFIERRRESEDCKIGYE